MGYSGRYHAASLVAVFIALAIGIVIGVGLADDVVSGASKELESSLRSDLDEANAKVDDLQQQLDRAHQFSDAAYPALVNDRLAGEKVAVVGLGALPNDTDTAVTDAVEPAGAEVAAKAVIAVPVDVEGLADAAGPKWAAAKRGGQELGRLGRRIGAELTGGGPLIRATGPTLFSRFSGRLNGADEIVVAPQDLSGLEGSELTRTESFLKGLYVGIESGSNGSVAVELTSTDPSVVGGASEAGMSTVDHADLTAGKTAIVFSLLGAEGDYGTREGDDSSLPDLLAPTSP